MHVTIHLTTGCNMSCGYCYSPPGLRNDMTEQIALQSINYIADVFPLNTGIIFFGGEPLLKKELIQQMISHGATKPGYFHYKITTNGILLDEQFLEYANRVKMQVSLSIDGNERAHNTFRTFPNGDHTFSIVKEKSRLLLQHQPYAKALMTVSPETLPYYADSVEFLLDCGFKYLVVSLNYAGNWDEKSLNELKKQYKRIAVLYEKCIMNEQKFYFSPFEMKLASHIRQNNFECYQCHLAQKQISIAFDGTIYPCVQFVKDGLSNRDYGIGSIFSGINTSRQAQMYIESQRKKQVCVDCDYNPRCNNKCSCMNWQLTGWLHEVSPVLCETERILIPIVDKLGERLFKKGAPMFIQKHYNAAYPIVSMIEDSH